MAASMSLGRPNQMMYVLFEAMLVRRLFASPMATDSRHR